MKKVLVLVLQPFAEDFRSAYEMVREAVTDAGAESMRLTDFRMAASLDDNLRAVLASADLVICDVSHKNPNVMYELGYVHAVEKPVILISQSVESVSADLHRSVLLRYDLVSISGGNLFVHELSKAIAAALQNPAKFADRTRSDIGNKVFISYSHRDQDFLRRLMVHLKPLEKKGAIELWADLNLVAGDNWKEKIKQALDRSRIAILLVSADFLASDFIVENELPPLLEMAETKGTRIIPVIVKPCRFRREKNLAKFQAINDPQSPLVCVSDADQETVYDKLAEAVEISLGKIV